MKTITFIVLLCLCVSGTFAQEKSNVEVYTESGVYFPKQSLLPSYTSGGVAFGAGLSYFKPIKEKFSVGIGLGYRFKENGSKSILPDYDKMLDPNTVYYFPSTYGGYSPYGYGYGYGGYSPYGYGYGGYTGYQSADNGLSYEPVPLKRQKIRIPQKSIVVPLKFRYFIEKPFFIQTGVEASILLNHNNANRRVGFNWTAGIGYKKNNFQCSLNYTEGITSQYMAENNLSTRYAQDVKCRMLTLNLSYPLWKR